VSKEISREHFPSFLKWISVLITICVIWGLVSFFKSEFPNVNLLKSRYPWIRAQVGSDEVEVVLRSKRPDNWVNIADVSRAAIGAIVVSEDWSFFWHHGYDFNQITEAIKKDWQRKKFARGASTITQQVVRNVFLEQDKNIWRKLKELYLAIQIEKVLSKNRILEIYLNIAEWGDGLYGVGSASRYYFGKDPSQITPKEGAFLAMLLPSPKRYSASFHDKKLTQYAKTTIEAILVKMVQAEYLTEQQMFQESSLRLSFENPSLMGIESAPTEELE
jgi:monofunctional biosynthetic peptidoglycan transglycosylase